MAQNKIIILFLIIIFSFMLCANIFAQNAAQLATESRAQEAAEDLEAGYFIDLSGETPRIIHRFVWRKEEYASRYEISIQAYKGYYTDFIIENTENTFFEVSLQPGLYRYSIASFDFLDMRAATTPWRQFEVIATHVPQVKRFLPEAFYLDQEKERVLHVAGVNINKDSKIYLSNEFNELYPVSVIVINEERAILNFDEAGLIPGDYDILILNQSGLGTRIGTFTVGYSKPFDIFIKTAYSPVVPIYGDLWNLLEADLFLAGYSMGIEFISSKRNTFNSGFELSASMFFLNSAVSFETSYADYMDGLKNAGDGAFFGDFDINAALQKRLFTNRIYFTFRFGIGVSIYSGFGAIEDFGFTMKLNASFSAMFRIYKILHFDVGADYSHYCTDNPFSLIKPRIGLIWKI